MSKLMLSLLDKMRFIKILWAINIALKTDPNDFQMGPKFTF